MEKIAVIGAGSWGTALAALLAEKGESVTLWAREVELVETIEKTRENSLFLPGVKLHANLAPTGKLSDALTGADLVVNVVPSHGIRDIFKAAATDIQPDAIIVSASKGIEQTSRLTATDILREVLPPALHGNICVLSGPSFAKEVSLHLPTTVSVAGESDENARRVQEVFSTGHFRVYTNTDPRGVELGGALKNVMAIAAGISDGLCLGHNARAGLITRGLSEMARLGVAMGGREKTFYGLSGLGDLVLTCTGGLSRNRTVGVELGKGRALDSIISEMNMVAEGVKTSRAVMDLSEEHGVPMPITESVCQVLYEGKPPGQAVEELMTRELKAES